MPKFHERLNFLKDEKNITQAQIADAIDITPQALSYYFNGREPNYDILLKLSDYFEISVDFLLGKTDIRSSNVDILNMVQLLGLDEETLNSLMDMKMSNLDKNIFYLNRTLQQFDFTHVFLDTLREYCIKNMIEINAENFFLKKYAKQNNLPIAEKELEEKGTFSLDIKDKHKFSLYLSNKKIERDIFYDLKYLKYKIKESIEKIIEDVLDDCITNYDEYLRIEPEIEEIYQLFDLNDRAEINLWFIENIDRLNLKSMN